MKIVQNENRFDYEVERFDVFRSLLALALLFGALGIATWRSALWLADQSTGLRFFVLSVSLYFVFMLTIGLIKRNAVSGSPEFVKMMATSAELGRHFRAKSGSAIFALLLSLLFAVVFGVSLWFMDASIVFLDREGMLGVVTLFAAVILWASVCESFLAWSARVEAQHLVKQLQGRDGSV